MENLSEQDKKAHDIVYKLFKNDYGEPFDMTPGQIELFRAIYEKQYTRVQFDCYTQYGKSDVVSMAVLLRAATFQEKWIILGATKDKAQIIMGKLIKHIFENDYTLGKFQVNEDETLDMIRRNKAKDHISFKVADNAISDVITLSADARRKSADAGDILIGHGGQNLIEDDAALIPDTIHGKALRMLGGHTGAGKSFLLKITNSFGRNHAYRSAVDSDNPYGTVTDNLLQLKENPLFHRIVINYVQGLKEGRLTEEFITEMRNALDPVMFGILYECVYPPPDMAEDGGWMVLLTEEQIRAAQERWGIQSMGIKRMGVDVAEGINNNAFVIRTDNVMYVKDKTAEKDLMKTADRVVEIARDENIAAENAFIDAVMIGAGPYARCHQMGYKINGVKAGEKAPEKKPGEEIIDPIDYYNLRAYMYWKFRTWILAGGALQPHTDWLQLTKIRYRTASDKRLQIMPKEMMRAMGYLQATESTDVPDGGSLTFAPSNIIKINNQASGPALPYYPEIDGGGNMSSGFGTFGGASPLSSSQL